MQGKLYLCATPIGNLGDMTPRVVETLNMVDVIAAEDTRNSIKLLNHFEIKTPMTSYHEYNKIDKGKYLVGLMQEGKQQGADQATFAHRYHDFENHTEGVGAVQLRRFNHFRGNGSEALGHDEGTQGHKNHRQCQGIIGFQQPHCIQNQVVGYQGNLQRHNHADNQQEEYDVVAREFALCKAVSRQDGYQYLSNRNAGAKTQAFPKPNQILGLRQKYLVKIIQCISTIRANQAANQNVEKRHNTKCDQKDHKNRENGFLRFHPLYASFRRTKR